MNKTEKRMKIFTLIMQVIIQAVLLFPWMNMGTWKCNVPGYLIKLAASGDGMSYIKKSLKPLGVLDGADEQMMVQILMLFICELVMVLVIQVIGIVNLILALSNHHKLLLDIMSLIRVDFYMRPTFNSYDIHFIVPAHIQFFQSFSTPFSRHWSFHYTIGRR